MEPRKERHSEPRQPVDRSLSDPTRPFGLALSIRFSAAVEDCRATFRCDVTAPLGRRAAALRALETRYRCPDARRRMPDPAAGSQRNREAARNSPPERAARSSPTSSPCRCGVSAVADFAAIVSAESSRVTMSVGLRTPGSCRLLIAGSGGARGSRSRPVTGIRSELDGWGVGRGCADRGRGHAVLEVTPGELSMTLRAGS